MKDKEFKRWSWSPISKIIVLIGCVLISAGFFLMNNLTSYGVTMIGKWGKSYARGTLDGKGLIWCGVVVIGFGLILVINKKP